MSPRAQLSFENLGPDSRSEKIRESGLWNVDHVEESYDPSFLDRFAEAVEETTPP